MECSVDGSGRGEKTERLAVRAGTDGQRERGEMRKGEEARRMGAEGRWEEEAGKWEMAAVRPSTLSTSW